jgi:hypothetical protein
MTPENIAGFTIPEAELRELLDALVDVQEDNVVPLHPAAAQQEAA